MGESTGGWLISPPPVGNGTAEVIYVQS